MKIAHLFLTMTLFFFANAFGQNNLLVLKNGSEIRGKIIEGTGDTIKIRTIDGSLWVYQPDEVAHISRYKIKNDNKYYISTTLSILGGTDVSPSFQVVNGYKFSRYWSVGLGLGIEQFYHDGYIPAFIETKFTLLDKPFSPFASLALGYDIPFRNQSGFLGGFMGSGQVGVKHQLGKHFGIITSIGYRKAHLKRVFTPWWTANKTTEIRQINRYEFRFGFIFM